MTLAFYATRIDPPKGGSMILVTKTSDQTRVCVCIYEISHNRAIRPYHPSNSMPLALTLPREDFGVLIRFSCGAGVVIRGSDLQDSGRYGREWSNWGWRKPALGGARHNDPVESWCLGGPSAEAVTSEKNPS